MTLEQIAIANDTPIADEQALESISLAAPSLRDCGCPQEGPCMCGPRLRIFDPMGRLLMSPVYY